MKNIDVIIPMYGRIVCVLITIFLSNFAVSEPEQPVNGLLVRATSSNDAVDHAFKRMLTTLNDVIAKKDGSKEIFDREFGNWLSKKTSLIDNANDTISNENAIRHLLEPAEGRVPEIVIPSTPPQRISESSDSEPRYYAIVALKNSKFRSAVVFLAIEGITPSGDGQYDIALVLGRFFVGDPSNPK